MAGDLVTVLTPILRDALCACYRYSLSEHHLPEEERLVCFAWAKRIHRTEFGGALHNTHLRQLARLGFLAKSDTSRQGNRRYYRITNAGLQEARMIQRDRDSMANSG